MYIWTESYACDAPGLLLVSELRLLSNFYLLRSKAFLVISICQLMKFEPISGRLANRLEAHFHFAMLRDYSKTQITWFSAFLFYLLKSMKIAIKLIFRNSFRLVRFFYWLWFKRLEKDSPEPFQMFQFAYFFFLILGKRRSFHIWKLFLGVQCLSVEGGPSRPKKLA